MARRPCLRPRSHLVSPRAVLGPFLTRNAGPPGPTHESAAYQRVPIRDNGWPIGRLRSPPLRPTPTAVCDCRCGRRPPSPGLRSDRPLTPAIAPSAYRPRRAGIAGDHEMVVRISGPCSGDRDRVLEVGGEGVVGGCDGPAVGLHVDVAVAEREHRLDRQADAGLELGAARARAVVRDLRVLVHLRADAVADERPDDAVAAGRPDVLDRGGDVADPPARPAPRRCRP